MSSLDGYSLNEKMDKLHDDVQCQIEQLQKDFHNLYECIKKLEKEGSNANTKPVQQDKKPSRKKKVSTVQGKVLEGQA
tara:strand:- start:5840 stop:6073 length:234 start_codon:yes stop_codon:yes gene_type:complete